jgi:CTD kinase subunit alpha
VISSSASEKSTGKVYALKELDMGEDEEEGTPKTTLRQLDIMLIPNHRNIIKGLEVVVDREDKYLLMEYAEHNLGTLLFDKHVQFSVQQV